MLLTEVQQYKMYDKKHLIRQWLHRAFIHAFDIRDDLSVDIHETIHFPQKWEYFPFKVNYISGSIIASHTRLKTFVNFPKAVGHSLYFSETRISSLEGIPERIDGLVMMQKLGQLGSLHNIHEHIKYIGGDTDLDRQLFCDAVPNMLGIMLIEGIKKVDVYDNDATITNIFNAYLPSKNIHMCQEALIDAGYPEVAKI